jgi:hypothetical protein
MDLKQPEPVEPHEVVTLTVLGAMWPWLTDYLRRQGFYLMEETDREDPDALRGFMTFPTARRMPPPERLAAQGERLGPMSSDNPPADFEG